MVDRDGWRELGDAGVFHLCLAEEAGGVGLGLAEAALVFEELGRSLVPGPLVASHLAAGLVDGADDGSVVVGLVERPAPGAAGTGVVPVVVEHLADLDVLLVLSDDGHRPPRPGVARRHPAPPSHGPPHPGVVGGRRCPPASPSPGPRWPPGGAATAPC